MRAVWFGGLMLVSPEERNGAHKKKDAENTSIVSEGFHWVVNDREHHLA
jgi:hypothetical protein